jgi:hypothetical protein
MSGITHCLDGFMRGLPLSDRAAVQARLDALPTVCPHADCSEPRNCREQCREFANDQMRIRNRLKRRA